jgi:CheY-like chemotaxis protein
MSGQDLLRRLRAGKHAPLVPALVVTAAETTEAALAPLGVVAVLGKPVAVDRLLAAVAGALAR